MAMMPGDHAIVVTRTTRGKGGTGVVGFFCRRSRGRISRALDLTLTRVYTMYSPLNIAKPQVYIFPNPWGRHATSPKHENSNRVCTKLFSPFFFLRALETFIHYARWAKTQPTLTPGKISRNIFIHVLRAAGS